MKTNLKIEHTALQRRVYRLLGRGQAAVERGRMAAARAHFTRALSIDPLCAYGLFFRAGALVLGGKLDAAAEDLEALGRLPADTLVRYREFEVPLARRAGYLARLDRLLARSRPPAWGFILRAFAMRELQRFPEAVSSALRAVEAAPASASLRAVLSRVRFVNRFPAEGLADLRLAVRLDPSCGWIRAWYAEGLRHRGRPRAALVELDRAIRLDGNYFRSYGWRGGIRNSFGRHAAALPDLKRALSVDWSYWWGYRRHGRDADPNFSWVLNERARALRGLGDTGAAIEDVNRAHALNNRYGWIFNPKGDAEVFRRGERELSELLLRRPRHAWARAWRGLTRLEAGRASEALADLDAAISRGVDRAWPLVWRARACAALGDRTGALADLDAALRIDRFYAPAWAWRGGLRRAAGRSSAAHSDLSRAVALDPVCAWAWAWRGELSSSRGDLRAALPDLHRALALDPDSHDAHLWRAQALLASGRHEAAAADARCACVLRPQSWQAWTTLSLIRAKAGDRAGQSRCLEQALPLVPQETRKLVPEAA